MENNKLYLMLQICDSAYPTGGFSHSMGTEAAFQNHFIKTKDDLKSFLFSSLENIGSSCIPFVKRSHEEYLEFHKLTMLDSLYHSSLLNHVANRASKQQGKSFLTTSCNIFKLPKMTELETLVEEEKLHGHLVVIFAVICASLLIPAFETGRLFLFSSLRTIISSLVRLGKVGAIQGQHLQFEMFAHLDDILLRNWNTDPENASIGFPVTDILQNTHDTLFSKLFYS